MNEALISLAERVRELEKENAQLRAKVAEGPPHVWMADPCWCGVTHWDPGQ